jgi:hypothetical protein
MPKAAMNPEAIPPKIALLPIKFSRKHHQHNANKGKNG